MHLAPDDSHAGADLLFVDPRTFGEVVVFDPANAAVEVPELARLGLDPIADPFTVADLRARLRGRRTRIKAAAPRPARDRRHRQHLLRRDPPPGACPPGPSRRLADAEPRSSACTGRSLDVLGAAVAAGGSTLGDAPVRRPDGGGWQLPGRAPRLRPRRRTLPDVRPGLHPSRHARRAQLLLVPCLPAALEARPRLGPNRVHLTRLTRTMQSALDSFAWNVPRRPLHATWQSSGLNLVDDASLPDMAVRGRSTGWPELASGTPCS